MRQSGGRSWMCLAPLAMLACGSVDPPPPEGNVSGTVAIGGQTYHSDIGGGIMPTDQVIGNTVLDGRGGKVSCNISGSGSYSVSASITSADNRTSISVSGTGVTSTAGTVKMDFSVSGYPNQVTSSTCTLTVKRIEAGSIWSNYTCTNVANPSDLTTNPGSANGTFVFTGCAR